MPLSRHSGENLSGNELTRNLSGNLRPQSSQLAEPLWTDPSLKNGISVRELISTSKKKKKAQAGAGYEWSNILPKSLQAWKTGTEGDDLDIKGLLGGGDVRGEDVD